MQYMLLIYLEEKDVPEDERRQCYQASADFAQQLNAKGQFVAAAPLQPTTTATSVRMQHGKPLITDGPFAETREQLGGFFLVNARDLDEAIDIAAHLPAGRYGTVEIRPVVEVPELPADPGRETIQNAAG
jgi:hypothetical protein